LFCNLYKTYIKQKQTHNYRLLLAGASGRKPRLF
jgi:hypothetical protein